jgi:hypothetical protein
VKSWTILLAGSRAATKAYSVFCKSSMFEGIVATSPRMTLELIWVKCDACERI